MSLQELRTELENASAGEEKKILAEAEAEATQIIRQANAEALKIREEALQQALVLAVAEERKLSSARLQARYIAAQAKSEVINEALDSLASTLQGLAVSKDKAKRAAYEAVFKRLAKEALSQMPPSAVINCRREDFELASKLGRVAKEPVATGGGLVVASADGTVRVDYTFKGLLEEKSEALTQAAHSVLFAGLSIELEGQEDAGHNASKPRRKSETTAKPPAARKTGRKRS